jgi:uroporphyrinogen-III decarboxylase
VDAVNAFCRQSDKFVLGPSSFAPLPRIFERLQFLRGTENLYMDLLEQRDEFLALLQRVHQYYVDVLELWAKTNVDALWAMDDWGSQQALLIAPDLWRAVLKPLYAEYASIARDNGKHFLFHSDGYIMDVYPDVIEMGFSAINSQIFCMGVENVGKRFRGELTFWGEIDRQHILPDGTREDVAKAVHTVQDYLWRDGGVIAQCEFTAGAQPENVYQVFKTWNEYRFDA